MIYTAPKPDCSRKVLKPTLGERLRAKGKRETPCPLPPERILSSSFSFPLPTDSISSQICCEKSAPKPQYQLRRYQTELIQEVMISWARGNRRVMLQLPTGGGKTLLFSAIAQEFRNHDMGVLVLAHRQELITQAAEKLELVSSLPVGIIKAGFPDNRDRQVQVASIQTLIRRKHFPDAGLVIFDEAHHSCSQSYLKIFQAYPNAYILGVTATPSRTDGQGFQLLYDDLICGPSATWLMKREYLSKFRLFAPAAQIKTEGVKITAGDFNQRELAEAIDTSLVMGDLIGTWRKYAEGKRTVVFTVDVRHSKAIAAAYAEAGIPSEHLDGETSEPKRNAILERFRRGETLILSNCLDDQTEILTKRGWVGINQIEQNDITATVNLSTEVMEWQPITRIVRRPRHPNERMVAIKNPTLDIRITEGHRMVVRSSPLVNWSIKEAGTLPTRIGAYEIPLAALGSPELVEMPLPADKYTKVGRRSGMRYHLRNLGGLDEVTGEARLDELAQSKMALRFKNPSQLTLAECRFIGLFLSDGHLINGGRGVTISQLNSENEWNAQIPETLNQCGFDWSVSTQTVASPAPSTSTLRSTQVITYRIPIGILGRQLERKGYFELIPYLNKDFSPYLNGLNQEQTIALIEGLGSRDGEKVKNRKNPAWRIVSNNQNFLDGLQALCVMRGLAANYGSSVQSPYPCSEPVHQLTIHKRDSIRTNTHHLSTNGGNPAYFEQNWRDEEVWCVTNNNGTIITRRNGKVAIMGQCGIVAEGFDVPAIEAVQCVRPTQSLVLWLQMIGRALRPSEGKDFARIIDHTENWKYHGLPDDDREWSLDPISLNTLRFSQKCPECNHIFKPLHHELKPHRHIRDAATFQLKPIYRATCPNCLTLMEFEMGTGGTGSARTLSEDEQTKVEEITLEASPKHQEIVDQLLATRDTKGYKAGWVYYQLLEHESIKSFGLGDWRYIASKLGYKSRWAWHRWQEVQVMQPALTQYGSVKPKFPLAKDLSFEDRADVIR